MKRSFRIVTSNVQIRTKIIRNKIKRFCFWARSKGNDRSCEWKYAFKWC